MSLTKEIGELTQSVNELTEEVKGKITQIDNKVKVATQAVPNAIKASLIYKTVYVEPYTGKDENNGSESSPYKSITAAISENTSHRYLEVVCLGENITHEIDSDIYLRHQTVKLRCMGNRIKFTESTGDWEGVTYSTVHGFQLSSSVIYIHGAELVVPEPDKNIHDGLGGCWLFSPFSGSNNVYLNRVKATFPISPDGNQFRLIGDNNWDSGGYLDLETYHSFSIHSDNPVIELQRRTMRIGDSSYDTEFLSLDGKTTKSWTDMVSGVICNASGTPINIISNVDFSAEAK